MVGIGHLLGFRRQQCDFSLRFWIHEHFQARAIPKGQDCASSSETDNSRCCLLGSICVGEPRCERLNQSAGWWEHGNRDKRCYLAGQYGNREVDYVFPEARNDIVEDVHDDSADHHHDSADYDDRAADHDDPVAVHDDSFADHHDRNADHHDRNADHYDRPADHYDRPADHYDRPADHYDRPADHYDNGRSSTGSGIPYWHCQ